MKIDSTLPHQPLDAVPGTGARSGGPSRGGAADTGSGRATIEFSPAARQLAALHEGGDDIRAERVRQIREALTDGTLKIDPSRIADGLLDSVRELLG